MDLLQISVAFYGTIPNRAGCLLRGGAYSDLSSDGMELIRELCLFEGQCLLEENTVRKLLK